MLDPRLEPAAKGGVHIDRGVAIAMRDGTILRADIYRPETSGCYPVLVERVPYELLSRAGQEGDYFASRGYVYVAQNVRGTFASEGIFRFLDDEGSGLMRDGYDTIEWANSQPWSNGSVATVGGSYSGYTQYAVAPTRPPHLRTMVVREGPSDIYHDVFTRGGAHQLGLMRDWILRAFLLPQLRSQPASAGLALRQQLEKAEEDIESWYWHLPLKSFAPVEGVADWYFEQLAHPEDGPYWWGRNAALKLGQLNVPILHVGGWHDIFVDSTLRCFQGARAHAGSEAARSGQRLVVGPWIHGLGELGVRQVGDVDFGSDADFDFNALQSRWFDHWLKGAENGVMDAPPVRIFLMGANRWLELADWPPAGAIATPLYFREGTGRSAESLNNGRLTFSPPDASERPDNFTSDPMKPVPSLLMYPELGPRDHRDVEARMLTYTTEPLEHDLTVMGSVRAVLHSLSSAPDTDWVVRLCDVWPDGRSLSVCDGILRGRYRTSFERPEPLRPGQLYQFEVDLSATAQAFQAGHRMRVEVTSSDFPRYDRNLNTGGPFGEEVLGRVAINTVFHDSTRPSQVLLPILAGGSP